MSSRQPASNIKAVIDIGTNSVKVLVGSVKGSDVIALYEKSEQTRLGKGLYTDHRLQPEAIADTASVVRTFVDAAREFSSESIRIIATSAARDAVNKDELVNSIQAATGLGVEVISGEEEADMVFRGVSTAPQLSDLPLLVVDVGGGSTEFILGCNHHKNAGESFKIGTVRLLESHPVSDPPTRKQMEASRAAMEAMFDNEVVPALRHKTKDINHGTILVGTGGTSTILARLKLKSKDFNREEIEGLRLQASELSELTQLIWSLPLAERKALPGMPGKRADVILMGTIIYSVLMNKLGFRELYISTRGLRYAALLSSATNASTAIA